jgi:hypothetical protein
MNRVIDRGHQYELLTLDGDDKQLLTFVKREGNKYPGNCGSHSGTTLQSVIRALIDRVEYLQNQIPCRENEGVLLNLQDALFLLESRAMRRHGLDSRHLTHAIVEQGEMCPKCGHVICDHLQ